MLISVAQATMRPVDPGLWRAAGEGLSDWMRRGAEAIGAQLYDLRPEEGS